MAYEPKPDEKSMGMLSHLLCIFTSWLGPLIIFLVKKDESPYVKLHAKQALVWGIALNVVFIPLIVISFIPFVGFINCLAVPAIVVIHYVFTIMGTVKVNKGEQFLYPVVAEMFCKEEIAAIYGEGAAPPPPPPGPPAPPPPPPGA